MHRAIKMRRYLLLLILRGCLCLNLEENNLVPNILVNNDDYGKMFGNSKACANTTKSFIRTAEYNSNADYNDVLKRSELSNVFTLYKKFHELILNLNSSNAGKSCRMSYEKLLDGIKSNEIDAVKMFDALPKFPTGLLSGNINQYGDFDECLSVEHAQYCLTEIDARRVWRKPFSKFKNLVHSHFPIQEEFNDPKHRVPGFTTIRFGICLPSDCTAEDLKMALEDTFGVQAKVNPSMCQSSKNQNFREKSVGFFLTRMLFMIIVLAALASTSLDMYWNGQIDSNSKLTKILFSFSVLRNWQQTFTIRNDENNNDKNEIRAVHGIRALSALCLLMSHKAMSLMFNPYINRTAMAEHFGSAWAVVGRTAIIYTDSFLFLSGLLNANALCNDMLNGRGLRFKDKLINRIFRITPNLVAVILFCTYLLPNFGSGPLWPLVVGHHASLCKKYMWRNILYIHNYFGFENMCLTHTHQVGIDMQLFLVTPLFIYILWLNRRIGTWLIGTVALLSTILRLWSSWANELSHMVHFGIPISRMFATANLSYILPTHRATVYFMGAYVAYFLKINKAATFSKHQLIFIWIVAVVVGFSPMFGPFHMAKVGYKYNLIDGSLYGAISPIFWGTGLTWAVYAANRGYAGWFGDFLSWKGFKLFTKISYAVYLVQFPVFFYNVGITKYSTEFKSHMLLELVDTMAIILISILLTLLVEVPFMNIKKMLFGVGGKRVASSSKKRFNRKG